MAGEAAGEGWRHERHRGDRRSRSPRPATRSRRSSPASRPRRLPPREPERTGFQRFLRDLATGSALITVLAIVVVARSSAAILIAVDRTRRCRPRRATSSPGPATRSPRSSKPVGGAYASLFQGGVYDFTATIVRRGHQPAPRQPRLRHPADRGRTRHRASASASGLFNIGGQGQILIAGAASPAGSASPGTGRPVVT